MVAQSLLRTGTAIARIAAIACVMVLAGCASQPTSCPTGTLDLPDCPPETAVTDPFIDQLYEDRTWLPPGKVDIDPVELGKAAEIPIEAARVKIFGTGEQSAIDALAARLWLIENADHTIDVMYYIFKADLIGNAVLGALCEAVQRGVDVRIMVDSTGSISLDHATLKALMTCAEDAGFMRNAEGQVTTRKARVQSVVFNALTKLASNPNRRSHDKLLVIDGSFPDKAVVITGGRNISLSYYGINEDGTPNHDTYKDLDILVRPPTGTVDDTESVGIVSEIYYTLLFLFPHNSALQPLTTSQAERIYVRYRRAFERDLSAIKEVPVIASRLDAMPTLLHEGLHDAEVLLAHELGNLTDTDVIHEPLANQDRNPNSIMYVLNEIDKSLPEGGLARYVSPYLFVARYKDKNGELLLDEAEEILRMLRENPDASVEIITNSVLTSDNFSAQAIIDMNTAPRLMLSPELRGAWIAASEFEDEIVDLINSPEWQQEIDASRVLLYQTGKLDSAHFVDGDVHYGKLHAKFIVLDDLSFVGTTNFDYRSRLYNNEMGFFVDDSDVAAELLGEFESLVETSYLWGTPEWFELRRAVVEAGGIKGTTTKQQRAIYKTLKKTGTHWLF